MDVVMSVVNAISSILWHDAVLFTLLGVGVLFTIWSGFGQYRALTHGVAVLRGQFDHAGDPGAINHFQALSAALSATVGLGNIAGVAIAVSLGGPGAVFWMWVTGVFGMALKMTEVTQTMLYRNLDDPDNPHGGAMWVVSRGLAKLSPRLAPLGKFLGGVFCVTLLTSTFTGGNMFQAWNVADITREYFGVPILITGIVLTALVSLVVVGGIQRIGAVAGRLVPFMCGIYLLAGLAVVAVRWQDVPDVFRLIFDSAFNPAEAQGAFLGGAVGWAFLRGMQRALFSSEAGQGSAPIAHAAVKTDEPVSEGVVAGLEPFIDTLCVCTLTALVILLSGVWNRAPDAAYAVDRVPALVEVEAGQWVPETTALPPHRDGSDWAEGDVLFAVVQADVDAQRGSDRHRLYGHVEASHGEASQGEASQGEAGPVGAGESEVQVRWDPLASTSRPRLLDGGLYTEYKGATLTAKAYDAVFPGLGFWLVPIAAWLFALSTMISWSYYGEQGIVFLFGERGVLPYRLIFCLAILVAASPLIRTEVQLDAISTLGTGFMLFANIPIMVLFGRQAMKAYHRYFDRLKRGELS